MPDETGKVVAFYSFKGGTGRTMALANVGCVLAQDLGVPRPILLVDWDLEAPGLHRYLRGKMERAFHGNEALQDEAPGLIDLFIELRTQLRKESESASDLDATAVVGLLDKFPFGSYVIETDIPRLHLLKAGRFDQDYASRISLFDWRELYSRSPSLLRSLAERLARDYSFVLIDSRTGLTDTSGICAMLLPEIVVTVFTPNRQSLTGVVDLVREAARYRRGSDDLRPLVVYPLPSRVEASQPALRKSWRFGEASQGIPGFQPTFERLLAEIYDLPTCDLSAYFDDVQIQHEPHYAYGEEVAVLGEESRDRFSLTRSYQRFAQLLSRGDRPWAEEEVPPDVESLIKQIPSEMLEIARRRIASDAYVKLVKETSARLAYEAAWGTQLLVGLLFLSAVPLAGVVVLPRIVQGNTGEGFALGAFALGISGLGSAVRRFANVRSKRRMATRIDGELMRLSKRLPPYDGDDAQERFEQNLQELMQKSAIQGTPAKRREAPRIMISYRRADASDVASFLYERLARHFGSDAVFMDVADLPPGVDFVDFLSRKVSEAQIVLALIGSNWSGFSIEGRRLDDPTDLVRAELAAALHQDKIVIPVLIDGARMPKEPELPSEIGGLATRNAATLGRASVNVDVERLIKGIETIRGW